MTIEHELDGKVAIVTGAANGIGKAIARLFAEQGARLLLADIEEDAGEALAAEINETGVGQARFRYCDVGERLDVRNLVCAADDAYDRLDILVSNAGVALGGPFLDLAEEDFDKVLRTNLKGTFLLGQEVALRMAGNGEEEPPGGTIINMASVNSVVAIAGQAAYVASKGGIQQLTRAMAIDLAPYNIRVNAIGPGSIRTDMLAGVNDNPDVMKRILSRTPLGRVGLPEEVAEAALFLASDRSSYMTGETLFVDGGRLALNYTVEPKG